jgi:hypothetical protein
MFVDRRLLPLATPQPPFLTLFTTLPRTTSAVEMTDTMYQLWCLVEGDDTLFPIIAPSTTSIGVLKDMIKEKGINPTEHAVDAKGLTLWKVRMSIASDNTTNSPAG